MFSIELETKNIKCEKILTCINQQTGIDSKRDGKTQPIYQIACSKKCINILRPVKTEKPLMA